MSNMNSLLTTRTRSFSQASLRKRLIRSSSQNQSQKELIKNSTMTSFKPKLQRLIREGKVEQILNSDKHSKANLIYSGHVNEIEKQLANSKKALSTMVLKAKQKEFNINRLKNQMARISKERQSLNQNNERINKIYQGTVTTLQGKRQQKQTTQWTQKSFLYMRERLLKDQYHYRNSYQAHQKVLQEQKTRSSFLQRKMHQIMNQGKQIQKIVNTAKQISSQQTSQKNEFIDMINQQRQQKQLLHEIKIDKKKKQASINGLSGWVIQREELAKYMNILYTHRILRQIIRTKNLNLIKKYQAVQKAYIHIKSNTNIVEFDKILKKMQDQDLIYDITIKKVTDLEDQLHRLEKQIEKAKKQRHNILSAQGKNNVHQKNYYQGIQKDKYELLLSQKQKIQFKINQDQISKQRIIQWGNKLAQKLNINRLPNQQFQVTLQMCVKMLKSKKPNK